MLYPLLFEPILADKPWGGSRLSTYGKAISGQGRTGESWEIADLDLGESGSVPESQSRVANGPLEGRTLHSLVGEFGEDLLGDTAPVAGRFPLLVKYLDTGEPLSVQVHPTADYVAGHPGTHLKVETWYVVEADPGAVIYKGFRPGTTGADVERAAGSRALVDLLVQVPVLAGDIHHLPAGTVHAVGAGVLLAEVQTPSDTTFRLYDWDDEFTRPRRDLHIGQALACLDVGRPAETEPAQIDLTVRALVETPYYWMNEHRSDEGGLALDPRPGPRILMVLDGTILVGDVPAARGSTVLMPASVRPEARSDQPVVVLEIGLNG